jgi:predicted nucleic acid-binding protein
MSGIIHLDTSFLIRVLVAGTPEDEIMRDWLRNERQIVMSTICWSEFLCGPLGHEDIAETRTFLQQLVPFLEEDAMKCAELFNQSARKRGTIIDCMVAAQAIRCSAMLVTSNPSDFKKFRPAGLLLMEW